MKCRYCFADTEDGMCWACKLLVFQAVERWAAVVEARRKQPTS